MKPIKRLSLLLIILTFINLCILNLQAENNPYHSDVLWVTVPDHADWIYKTGENANVEIQFFKYGIPQDGLTVTYELGGDMMPADTKGSIVLKKGKAVIPMGTMQEPGFRDCNLRIELDDKIYKHHVKVGFSQEEIRPVTQLPSDFKSFWDSNLQEASKYPLNYTRKYIEEYSTDKIDCYLVQLF